MTTTSAPILALDTSGSFCSVALSTPSGVVIHRESEGAGDHFERLPGLVSDVLAEAKASAGDLKEIRVGLGPGSFTGLRIGLSFAKGLAVAARVVLRGVSSFDGVAWSVCEHNGGLKDRSILVVSDARRDEVFMCAYEFTAVQGMHGSVPRIAPAAAVGEWLGRHPGGIVATPIREFVVKNCVDLQVASRIAEGLLKVEAPLGAAFDLREVAVLEPSYLREVAAKSIAERRGA